MSSINSTTSVPSVFRRFLKSSWKKQRGSIVESTTFSPLLPPKKPVLRLSRGRALGHKGSFVFGDTTCLSPGLVGFYSSTWSWHPKTHRTCLEPSNFLVMCVSPSKKQDLDLPSTRGSFGFQVPPMDSHHQPPFWFLCNPAAPARGQNGWWFASWVPSGNVWSRQWNSRHSSGSWTHKKGELWEMIQKSYTKQWKVEQKKWWDHLPTSTGLQDFGQRYLEPSQTCSPRMTGWRKFQLDLHESSKDMGRFPGSMQKSQWPYVKQNKFPKGLWRRSGKGFTASAGADSSEELLLGSPRSCTLLIQSYLTRWLQCVWKLCLDQRRKESSSIFEMKIIKCLVSPPSLRHEQQKTL